MTSPTPGALNFFFFNNYKFFLLGFHYCVNFLRKQEDTAIKKKLQEEETCSIFDIVNDNFLLKSPLSPSPLFCECTAWVYILQM